MNEKNEFYNNAKLEVTPSEARQILRASGGRVSDPNVDAFVSLHGINKIYPNGVQAVYDFNIDINQHEFIVLVGPSGCGKSTTLRMVAGLESITSGYLYIDKVLANYLSSKDRDISMVFQSYALYPSMSVYENIAFPLKVRKYKKAVKADDLQIADQLEAVFFNKELLFAAYHEANEKNLSNRVKIQYFSSRLHIRDEVSKILLKYDGEYVNPMDLCQFDNEIAAIVAEYRDSGTTFVNNEGAMLGEDYVLMYPDGAHYYEAKLTKNEIREKVFNAAKVLDLGQYLDRKPGELSGGQMQRVALGRAIVRNAKLFLMDEPLSNLDAKLRVAMRSEIVRLHEAIGATTIYVTHDQTEAMTMATRIAVMSKGWVQQIGTPKEIYNNPANIFVATFIGAPAMNIIKANYDNGVVTFADGYKISMGQKFVEVHDKFYANAIANVERMLETDDFKKMHAITLLDEIEAADVVNNPAAVELIVDRVNQIEAIVAFLSNGEDAGLLFNLINNFRAVLPSPGGFNKGQYKRALLELKGVLYDLKEVSSADLGLLHNATIFNDDKDKKEDAFVYDKRKKKAKKKRKLNFKVHNLVFSDNLYVTAKELLEKFRFDANNPHPVNFGVRPEFIHIDREFDNKNKSQRFVVNTDVVELMGQELLVHSDWNGTDLISKISTGTMVKAHTKLDLTFDMDKVLLFDVTTGQRIK